MKLKLELIVCLKKWNVLRRSVTSPKAAVGSQAHANEICGNTTGMFAAICNTNLVVDMSNLKNRELTVMSSVPNCTFPYPAGCRVIYCPTKPSLANRSSPCDLPRSYCLGCILSGSHQVQCSCHGASEDASSDRSRGLWNVQYQLPRQHLATRKSHRVITGEMPAGVLTFDVRNDFPAYHLTLITG